MHLSNLGKCICQPQSLAFPNVAVNIISKLQSIIRIYTAPSKLQKDSMARFALQVMPQNMQTFCIWGFFLEGLKKETLQGNGNKEREYGSVRCHFVFVMSLSSVAQSIHLTMCPVSNLTPIKKKNLCCRQCNLGDVSQIFSST